ncbi:MAG: hypothetical protein JWM36_3836 [Hyphomicrobiales bacterium]|nr:hypothetical protein [Hyphomicrobiales bacterium]
MQPHVAPTSSDTPPAAFGTGGRPGSIRSSLASGAWLTRERVTAYAGMLVAGYAVTAILVVGTSQGMLDRLGRPVGTDFAMLWTAGLAVLHGDAELPFSLSRLAAMMAALFGPEAGVTPWHYPPYFLPVAAALAALPYFWALALWQGGTLCLYLAAMLASMSQSAARQGQVILLAAAYPAVFVNLGHGQNGFLTASLFAAGAVNITRRPWLAGVCFALLSYKPQFMLVLPVALLAGRHWRTIAAGCGTWLVLTLALHEWLGAGPWLAFFDSLPDTRRLTLELGATGWEKIQTVFGAMRLVGCPMWLAYAAQAATTLCVLIAVARIWASDVDARLKGAALMTAALLSTPYCVDYDLVILGPAMALLVSYALEKGFAPYEISLLALVWIMPLAARLVAGATFIPLGPVVQILFFVWLVRRSRDAATPYRGVPMLPLSQTPLAGK